MATRHSDGTQLELWPTGTQIEAAVKPREALKTSTETPARARHQRPTPRRKKSARAPVPALQTSPATVKNDTSQLWSIDEVANYLNVSKDTIYGWRKTGYGPPASKIGKHLRWRPQDVGAWVDRLREIALAPTD